MNVLRLLPLVSILLLTFSGIVRADYDLVTLSDATTPRVAFDVQRQEKSLLFSVEVDGFEASGKDVDLQMGVATHQTMRLNAADAQRHVEDQRVRFEFSVPASKLVTQESDWDKLRVAFTVTWSSKNGSDIPRLQRSFFQNPMRASHAALAEDPKEWLAFDLISWRQQSLDRAQQIAIPLKQPMDGKASIVIEDNTGKRIRNLISARPTAAGVHRVIWDGLDEQGNVCLPGDYRWRAVSHPGLTPEHQMDFVNGPGSNHGTLHAATTFADKVYFAAPVAEGGHEITELDQAGVFQRGFNPPHGHGLKDVAIAADEKYLYVLHDGMAWGDKVDRSKTDWKGTNTLSLMRLNRETWRLEEFADKVRYVPLKKYDFGPGSASKRDDKAQALAGLTFFDGKLYAGDAIDNAVLVIDPATGKVERSLPLDHPVALHGSEAGLFVITSSALIRLDVTSGKITQITKLNGTPAGLTVDGTGNFYVSNHADHTVQVFDSRGKPLSTIGHPGGLKIGTYDALQYHQPTGLAVINDRLWITEKNRWQPKRLSAYDLTQKRVSLEYFGPTNYGAQGGGFDPLDHTRWIGQGTLFQLDFTKKKATPVSILGGETGRRHTFYRQDGRTFIITSGKATYLQELLDDGTLKPLALLSSAHQFAYANDWYPPAAFTEAFSAAYPEVKVNPGQRGGIQRMQPNHGYGMLWVDKNGDSIMQAEEIEFSTAADNFAGSGWSHDFHDLTLRVPATVQGQSKLVTLNPDGWWPGGAPRYPALNEAVENGVDIDLPGSNQVESAVDRFGNVIMNSTPEMRAFSSTGKLLWTYRNEWSGVHGSHKAPLPSVGQLQGVLFFSGIAPLDDKTDVMLMNGNHGQAFIMTTDGLYVDAVFPDVRLMTNPQGGGIGILGGECFGGTFGRSEKDGNYYFQGGGIAYRIYRIDGLKELQRSHGEFNVSAEQAALAERQQAQKLAQQQELRAGGVTYIKQPPVIDGQDKEWTGILPLAKWQRSDRFPVTMKAAYDAEHLYLYYQVKDESPWINKGTDWQSLFKTGDGVDLQLGTNPTAKANRTQPVAGDLRLFIAPSADGDVVVLYRHRVPEAKENEGVVFQSPWRSEKVDVVKRLENARIAIKRGPNEYRVEAAIPLQELGLSTSPQPPVLRGDVGVIYGDREGSINIFRNYWSNEATGLVNDVPGEIMLNPSLWGQIRFEPAR